MLLKKTISGGSDFTQLNAPCETIISTDNLEFQIKILTSLIEKPVQNPIELESKLIELIERVKEVGIYSLSKSYNDELLWAHYSNSHRGFCIGYDFNSLNETYPFEKFYTFNVEYKNNPPKIELPDIYDDNIVAIVKS